MRDYHYTIVICTLCLTAFIAACVLLANVNSSGPRPSCVAHGGFLRTAPGANEPARNMICKDGTAVLLP